MSERVDFSNGILHWHIIEPDILIFSVMQFKNVLHRSKKLLHTSQVLPAEPQTQVFAVPLTLMWKTFVRLCLAEKIIYKCFLLYNNKSHV